MLCVLLTLAKICGLIKRSNHLNIEHIFSPLRNRVRPGECVVSVKFICVNYYRNFFIIAAAQQFFQTISDFHHVVAAIPHVQVRNKKETQFFLDKMNISIRLNVVRREFLTFYDHIVRFVRMKSFWMSDKMLTRQFGHNKFPYFEQWHNRVEWISIVSLQIDFIQFEYQLMNWIGNKNMSLSNRYWYFQSIPWDSIKVAGIIEIYSINNTQHVIHINESYFVCIRLHHIIYSKIRFWLFFMRKKVVFIDSPWSQRIHRRSVYWLCFKHLPLLILLLLTKCLYWLFTNILIPLKPILALYSHIIVGIRCDLIIHKYISDRFIWIR